jgi:ubiquitin-protein ligase
MEEQIKKYLNNENIESKFILNRLLRESIYFEQYFNSLSVSSHNNYYHILVKDKNNYKYNEYCFILDNNYPFKPPKLLINNINYKKFCMRSSNLYYDLFYKISGIRCMCCYNLLAYDKWSPGNKLVDVIKEINTFRQYKKNLIYKIMVDKIKNKYLINDIDLESWLF